MLWPRTIILFVHLVGAMFLVGELLLLAIVVGPYARTLEPSARRQLMESVGRRSRPWAWGAVGLLVVTGVLNLALMGIPLAQLLSSRFWQSPFGTTLALKLLAVLALVVVMGVHDIALSRRAAALRALPSQGLPPSVASGLQTRRLQSLLGRLGLVLALVVVLLAARLATLS